ncbi:MAG: hypothetical protein R2880_10350 [Deinococcales bacterium]
MPNEVYLRTRNHLVTMVSARVADYTLGMAMEANHFQADTIRAQQMMELLKGPIYREFQLILPRDGLRKQLSYIIEELQQRSWSSLPIPTTKSLLIPRAYLREAHDAAKLQMSLYGTDPHVLLDNGTRAVLANQLSLSELADLMLASKTAAALTLEEETWPNPVIVAILENLRAEEAIERKRRALKRQEQALEVQEVLKKEGPKLVEGKADEVDVFASVQPLPISLDGLAGEVLEGVTGEVIGEVIGGVLETVKASSHGTTKGLSQASASASDPFVKEAASQISKPSASKHHASNHAISNPTIAKHHVSNPHVSKHAISEHNVLDAATDFENFDLGINQLNLQLSHQLSHPMADQVEMNSKAELRLKALEALKGSSPPPPTKFEAPIKPEPSATYPKFSLEKFKALALAFAQLEEMVSVELNHGGESLFARGERYALGTVLELLKASKHLPWQGRRLKLMYLWCQQSHIFVLFLGDSMMVLKGNPQLNIGLVFSMTLNFEESA